MLQTYPLMLTVRDMQFIKESILAILGLLVLSQKDIIYCTERHTLREETVPDNGKVTAL